MKIMAGMRLFHNTKYGGPEYYRVIRIDGDRALAVMDDGGGIDSELYTEVIIISKANGALYYDMGDPATVGCLKWDA